MQGGKKVHLLLSSSILCVPPPLSEVGHTKGAGSRCQFLVVV